jgi:hypothetical protein
MTIIPPDETELPSISIDAPGVTAIVLGEQCKSTLSAEQERQLAKDMEAARRSISRPKRVLVPLENYLYTPRIRLK